MNEPGVGGHRGEWAIFQECGGGRDPPALFSGYEGSTSCALSCIYHPSPQWCVEVLTPSTCGYDLIWKWGLSSCDQVKMKSRWIGVDPTPVDVPGGTGGKEHACQSRRCKRCVFDPRVEKIPWRRKRNPFQYSCLENPMGRRA